MAKRGKSVKKKKTASTSIDNRLDLRMTVDVKVGILHTVANAIYATPTGKIREAVANARDNEATWIVIVADWTTNTICIYDNGHGIQVNRFEEIFQSIGYGLLSMDPKTKLSYFGLGLMSIFQLGDKIKLFTRSREKKELLLLEVDTKAIFDPDNRDKSITTLTDYIALERVEENQRDASLAPKLDDFLEKKLGGKPESFTEIVIEDVNDEDLETICSPDFVDELRKVLPLRVEPGEPFLKQIAGNKRNKIRALLNSETFCPTIDVYFGVRGEVAIEGLEEDMEEQLPIEEEVGQIWKYFPKFRTDLEFLEANVWIYNPKNGDYAYYFVHTVAKDLHRHKEDTRENGFWIRNQNFLVKAADFLEKPGPGKRIISPPLRNWIFGEIFHKNMNQFLTVSRNDFLFGEKAFENFREQIFEIVRPLNKTLRMIWEEQNRIVDRVIKPFSQIGEPGGPLEGTRQRLRHLVGEEVTEQKFREDMFERLAQQRNEEIEVREAQVDIILAETQDPILLGEEENVLVQIDPSIKDKVQDCQVAWDEKNERVIVSVSPNLFDPKEVIFLGEKFELVFVAKEESDPSVSVNVEEKRIYVNPFNKELSQYSVSILDILIALEVADALSQTKPELKKNFLSLIGARPTGVYKYVAPLGDDLRRTMAFSRPGV